MNLSKLSILIYHRVLEAPDSFLPSEVDITAFDKQMLWVKRFFNVVSLEEGVRKLGLGTLPPRSLCITFDDGYKDNYTNALPILQKHNLTATFFVSTGFLDGGTMWNDSIIEAFRNTEKADLDLRAFNFGQYSLIEGKQRVLADVIEKIKFLSFSDRLHAVDELKKQLNVEDPVSLMMTIEELQKLSSSGMDIGGHTVRHPILSRLNFDDAKKEIILGKKKLEEILGYEITSFAYPNGKPGRDYAKENVDIVRQAGFKIAVSTARGVATPSSDVYQLPRFTPWDKNVGKFILRLYKNRFSSKEDFV